MRVDKNITLFNRVVVNREDVLLKTYIYGVHWEDVEGVNNNTSAGLQVDKSTIYIPFTAKASDGKIYKSPKSFQKDREGSFTFKKDDIIIKGIVEDEYRTLVEMEKALDDVRVISSVDKNDFGSFEMQHYEIGAR